MRTSGAVRLKSELSFLSLARLPQAYFLILSLSSLSERRFHFSNPAVANVPFPTGFMSLARDTKVTRDKCFFFFFPHFSFVAITGPKS